jgi:uncharacterized protein
VTRDGLTVIDADGHVQEPSDLWERYIDPAYAEFAPRCDATRTDNLFSVDGLVMPRMFVPAVGRMDYRRSLVGQWNARFAAQFSLGDAGFSSRSYLEELDREGIDRMVLFPSRGLYAAAVEHLDGGLSAAICRAYNDWLAGFCAADPARLVAVALVALHDPAAAAAEVRRTVTKLGMRGAMVRPNPCAGRNLEDPAHDVVWAELESLGATLAVHEGSGSWMPAYGDRYPGSYLAQHAMSHPMEQMGAVYALTVGGVLERHPSLRVAILEAGATWLPYWLHRLDEHVEQLRDVPSETGWLSRSPSVAFRAQCWISCEPDEPNVRALIDSIGADRLLWASDYPHPDCNYPGMVDHLAKGAEANGLTRDELRLWAGDNARRCYGLA